MPKTEFDGLPVIDTDESEEITVAVKPQDIQEGKEANPEQHPIAIAWRHRRRACVQARGVDPAR